MGGLIGTILRAALAARLGYMQTAAGSYIRDQIESGKNSLHGYVVSAGFSAVAAIFLIAALMVGASALFDWTEINYGRFTAYGVTGGGLLVLALIAIALASAASRKHQKHVPGLSSRMRVAMRAPAAKEANAKRDPIASAQNTARQVLRSPPSPRGTLHTDTSPLVQKAGIAAAVGLIGWALVRRYSQPAPGPRPQSPQG